MLYSPITYIQTIFALGQMWWRQMCLILHLWRNCESRYRPALQPQKGRENHFLLLSHFTPPQCNAQLHVMRVIRDVICWITAKSSSLVSRSKNNCGLKQKSTAGMQVSQSPRMFRVYIRRVWRARRGRRGAGVISLSAWYTVLQLRHHHRSLVKTEATEDEVLCMDFSFFTLKGSMVQRRNGWLTVFNSFTL